MLYNHQSLGWALRAIGIACALTLTSAAARGATIYVKANAPPFGNGSSWASPFQRLQDALAVAVDGDQIWVTAATYFPDQGGGQTPGDENAAFELVSGVQILGGFVGNELDADDRDPALNETILSGDIGVPDDDSDNSLRVVSVFTANPMTVLDGFTITRGRAVNDGGGIRIEPGGAAPTIKDCLFIDNGAPSTNGGGLASFGAAAPMIIDCVFVNNFAGGRGGGAWASLGTFINCVFQDNDADRGGGLFCDGGPTVIDCLFDGNTAQRGGGLSNTGNITVEGCVFIDNVTTGPGGGMYAFGTGGGDTTLINCTFTGNTSAQGGGGVYNDRIGVSKILGCLFLGNSGTFGGGLTDRGNATIVNCLFSGNVASGSGGGILKFGSAATIVNCTLAGNSATSDSGGISSSSSLTVANCILWGNDVNATQDETAQINSSASIAIDYSCVQGLTGALGGTGNIGNDPTFVDPAGPDLIPGTTDDDLRLQAGSASADAGDNTAVPADEFDFDEDLNTAEPIPFDLDGNSRFSDDPGAPDTGNGASPIVDMGSYEFHGPPPPGTYVGPDGGSWFDPANWAGGVVPDASTDVFVSTTVVVDQSGATANLITVHDGGTLMLGAGSLVASALLIESGGTLALIDPIAYLEVQTITALEGSTLQWDAGTIRLLTGGSWNNLVQPIAFGCVGPGALVVESGATVVASTIDVCTMGVLSGSGTLTADVTNAGQVSPGTSIGVLFINGSFVQMSTGTLLIEMAGYLPGSEHDQLVATDSATLDGALDVVLLGGFVEELSGDQRIVVAPSIAGTFATENIPALPGAFLLELNYNVLSDDASNLTVQLLTTLSATGPRLYVNQAAGPGGDGQSWVTATNDFQAALEFASMGASAGDEIWVAAGTYTPDRGSGDRFDSFELSVNGLAIYGGFAGGETDLSERDVATNVTILSGDLAGDDGPNFANNEENSYHVVTAKQTGACELLVAGTCIDGLTPAECNAFGDGNWLGPGTTCPAGDIEPMTLDGFTIRGGNADKPDDTEHSRGGGVNNNQDLGVLSIVNCQIIENYARLRGGGMFDAGILTMVSNCQFSGNLTLVGGGGYATEANGGTPQLTNCIFEFNEADFGGGAYVSENADPVFQLCSFSSNQAGKGGGLHIEQTIGIAEVTLLTCTFEDNIGTAGAGGIRIEADCSVDATGCIFTNNSVRAITNNGGTLSLTDCTFDGNSAPGANATGGAVSSAGANGTLNFVAGNTTFTGNSTTGTGGAVHVSSGDAELSGCTFNGNTAGVAGGGLSIQSGSTVTLLGGTFSGNGAPVGSGIFNDGNLAGHSSLATDELFNGKHFRPGGSGPGGAIGLWTIDGTYVQPDLAGAQALAPVLFMDIAGTLPGTEHDLIDAASGQVDIGGGGLFVDFVEGFVPEVGQSFDIISAFMLSGEFDVTSLSGVPPGLFLSVQYDPGPPGGGGVSLTVEQLEGLLAFGNPDDFALTGTPTDAVLGDFDGDADLDVAVAVAAAPVTNPGSVFVLRNAGVDGLGNWLGFTEGTTETIVGANPLAIVAGMLDSGVDLDLAVAEFDGDSVGVLLNNGTGDATFSFQSYAAGDGPISLAAGKITPVGAVDLAVGLAGDRRARILDNDGNGVFTIGQDLVEVGFPFIFPMAVELADVDNDTDRDAVVLYRAGAFDDTMAPSFVAVYPYTGGLFGSSTTFTVGAGAAAMDLGTLDADAFLDIVTADQGAASASVLTNDPASPGAFNAAVSLVVGSEPRSLELVDLDVDGDLDIVVVAKDASNIPSLFLVRNDLNAGDQLILVGATELQTNGEALAIFSGDLDDDGFPDLVALNGAGGAFGAESAEPAAASVAALLNEFGLPPCPTDITGDGVTNVLDLIELLLCFGLPATPGCEPADVNTDGNVNVLDLIELLLAFGTTCP